MKWCTQRSDHINKNTDYHEYPDFFIGRMEEWMTNYLHEDLTKLIIEKFFKVYNKLGYGFLERVYENALFLELKKAELEVEIQKPIKVLYDGTVVGNYIADFVVEDKIIIEVKACEELNKAHEAQLLNYLRATDIEVGLLLGFCRKPSIKRKVFTNSI